MTKIHRLFLVVLLLLLELEVGMNLFEETG